MKIQVGRIGANQRVVDCSCTLIFTVACLDIMTLNEMLPKLISIALSKAKGTFHSNRALYHPLSYTFLLLYRFCFIWIFLSYWCTNILWLNCHVDSIISGLLEIFVLLEGLYALVRRILRQAIVSICIDSLIQYSSLLVS